MTKKPLIVLIDGSAVFHRGYHAIPHLSTRDGVPTNAVLGFANIVLKVLNELKPTYAVVAWDKSSKTFRNELYPAYKAHRIKQPDDLYAQIPSTHELVDALHLPWIELDNFEADDIIGTLARQAEDRGDLDIVIATGDKDQLQLIDKSTVVDMFNPRGMEPTRYDLAKMHDRYGMTPAQFIDYKALVGDPSDNIPGVAGIGDVGARKLIGEFGTLDGIYEGIDGIVGKTGDKLRANREMAYLSRKLSVIVLDAPVELNLKAARVGHYDREHITELFHRLEFRSLLAKLPPQMSDVPAAAEHAEPVGPLSLFGEGDVATANSAAPRNSAAPPDRKHLESVTYTAVTTDAQFEQFLSELQSQSNFAFDTETTAIDISVAELVGLSFSWADGIAYYVPVGHTEGPQLDRQLVLDRLKPILENPEKGVYGHNIKYDVSMLAKYGVNIARVAFDTMIAAFLINSAGRSQSLDGLAYSELGVEMIPIAEMIGTGKTQITFDQVAISDATIYAAEDADMSWRLAVKLQKRLIEENLDDLARQMEWPLIAILSKMELAGIELDAPFLRKFGDRLSVELGKLRTDIYDFAGEEFNLNSPAQLAQILYGRLGLSTVGIKKGKTGFSTAVGELEKLRAGNPIIEHIMSFREYDKLKNTYVDALPELVKADGRIHTSFNQTIAQTGRLSSTNPNLQNIPVRTAMGREIRQAFVAPAGRVFVGADYSQIELRVAAALARDETMIETFTKGIDLHQQTAAELFGVPLEAVTKDQRYNSKTINFGVLYGMSAHGLSVATGMDPKQAGEFIKRYFEVRPKLAQYIEDTKKFAYDHLYTATMFGRRRPCPEIRSTNFQIRQGAERVAVNVPIQGTAADIYKLAMIALDARLDDDCILLLQIHDELIVEAPEAKAEAVAELMREVMVNVFDLGVPLAVDTAIGKNWGEI